MNTSNTAIILIGFQNDYFATNGVLNNVFEDQQMLSNVLKNTVNLVSELIDQDLTIISTPIFFTPNYEELVDPVGLLKTIQDVRAFQVNTPGAQSITEFQPFQEKILEVPGKRGFNAFTGTHLQELLTQKQITSIILAGAVTSVCIDSTGRAAHEYGYQVSILSDCILARTAFEQEFYVSSIFPLYADVISSSQLLNSFKLSPSS
ncbi:MAG: cysteine hydrolase family protein [Coleofasciculaceae cyanobacterium RL_1_1]|nr:cysteine hydrolase family protein [Coleofasciculaceae cyanobacterium RL_1_1]